MGTFGVVAAVVQYDLRWLVLTGLAAAVWAADRLIARREARKP
jgi:hypothetical protein